MKKVVSNKKLREKILYAINLLCDPVKTTLGPKCNNVIIDHSSFAPFITNDGVTIANNIESDDAVINTILEIAKDASINTNEFVGDGTTTTLVLLQAIYTKGLEFIENGVNPIILKKELNNSLNKIIKELYSYSHKPTNKEIINLAKISSNSCEVGEIIGKVYLKMKEKNSISIYESEKNETEIVYKRGYSLKTFLASSYFLKDKKGIIFDKPLILILNSFINDIEEISDIVNYIIENKKKLIIIAEDYSDSFVNNILSLYLDENVNIILLKISEYGNNKVDIIDDLLSITDASLLNNLDDLNLHCLGNVDQVSITSSESIFKFKINDNIRKKIKFLKRKLCDCESMDQDFLQKRIAMLKNGLAEIYVGAHTKIECREKKMRFDDALSAIFTCKEGVIPGSGLILYEISDSIKVESYADEIFKYALKSPFLAIMFNAGLESSEIMSIIKDSNYRRIYNVKTDKFENIDNTEVIDSLSVVIKSLVNAVSVASMLLTTSTLIINEYDNNLNKITEYNNV